MKSRLRLLAIVFSIFAAVPAVAQTMICGAICDETWTTGGSPYVVTCDTTVSAGCTLTIDAGVEVRFQAAADLTVQGTLDVNGTSGSPVLFTSDAVTPAAGDWDYIDVRDSGVAEVDFATVEYADRGIYMVQASTTTLNDVTVRHNNWGLWADTSPTVTLTNVTAETSTFDGMRARHVHLTGTGNRFVNNNRYGLQIEAQSTADVVSLRDGELHSNGSFGLFCRPGGDAARFLLDVRNNWWGSTDPLTVAGTVFDHVDSAGVSVADYCDYLDGPGGLPVVDAHCPDLTVCDGMQSLLLTDKPYLMVSDMLVCSTGTLEVGPDVTVIVDPHVDLAEILVTDGTIDVNGAPGAEALFTSRAMVPAPGDWEGIQLQGNAVGTFDHLIVEYADRGMFTFGTPTVSLTGVTSRLNTWGLWFDNATNVTLTDVVSRESGFDGLRVRTSVVSGSGNKFVNNTRHGVQVEAMSLSDTFALHDGEIHSNGSLGLYLTGGIDFERYFLDVRNNWWGTTDPALIGAAIRDHTDQASLAVADHCDYLDGPGGVPAVSAHCPDLTVCDGTTSLLLTDKPYLMNGDTVVCSTGTLEVGPGVAVLVDPNPGLLEVAVNGGAVDIHGTAGAEVSFASRAVSPAPGDWDGFDVRAGGFAAVERTVVEHADRGFFILQSSGASLDRVTTRRNVWGLWIDGAGTSANLNRVVSTENDFDGLRAVGSSTVDATGCRFVNNSRYGVYLQALSGNPDVGLAACSLYGNLGGRDVYADNSWVSPATTIIRATDNWWGATDDEVIRSRIRDYEDQSSLPRIYHRANGDACGIGVGIDGDGDGLGDVEDNCPGVANAAQTDSDLDEMGDDCDPDPLNPPAGSCDGVNDVADGHTDLDGDGWGDPCDIEPVRSDVFTGATEICDGLDNDGDGVEFADELVDDDFDLNMLCGDCDDFDPAVHVCTCEDCTNLIDDDCNGTSDGLDPLCAAVPNCLLLGTAPGPVLTMHRGTCGATNLSGPFDVIRGELAQVVSTGGSIDLGNVACVGDNVALDRVTDLSADPTDICGGTPVVFYLARDDGDTDFGVSSSSEPRDITAPDPACP